MDWGRSGTGMNSGCENIIERSPPAYPKHVVELIHQREVVKGKLELERVNDVLQNRLAEVAGGWCAQGLD
jgi:hypothetical protein